MYQPFAFMAEEVGEGPALSLSYSPFAIYDAFDTGSSVDTANNFWSTTISTGSGDSTFDTDFGQASDSLPTWNSNGYWPIRTVSPSIAQGESFRYSASTGVTDPFSFLTNTSHTIFAYYRPISYFSNGVDILSNGTTAGSILLMNFNSKTRAHAWVTAAKTVDDTLTQSLNTWYIAGQRLVVSGGSSSISAFTCTIGGSVSITTSNFTYSAPTSTNALNVGGRATNNLRSNMDLANYSLYRKNLSDAEIQTVCDELSAYYGTPT